MYGPHEECVEDEQEDKGQDRDEEYIYDPRIYTRVTVVVGELSVFHVCVRLVRHVVVVTSHLHHA